MAALQALTSTTLGNTTQSLKADLSHGCCDLAAPRSHSRHSNHNLGAQHLLCLPVSMVSFVVHCLLELHRNHPVH